MENKVRQKPRGQSLEEEDRSFNPRQCEEVSKRFSAHILTQGHSTSQDGKRSTSKKEMARWEDDGGTVRETRTENLKSSSR